jgi:hypothetical protein
MTDPTWIYYKMMKKIIPCSDDLCSKIVAYTISTNSIIKQQDSDLWFDDLLYVIIAMAKEWNDKKACNKLEPIHWIHGFFLISIFILYEYKDKNQCIHWIYVINKNNPLSDAMKLFESFKGKKIIVDGIELLIPGSNNIWTSGEKRRNFAVKTWKFLLKSYKKHDLLNQIIKTLTKNKCQIEFLLYQIDFYLPQELDSEEESD